jgi:hypothetical protein
MDRAEALRRLEDQELEIIEQYHGGDPGIGALLLWLLFWLTVVGLVIATGEGLLTEAQAWRDVESCVGRVPQEGWPALGVGLAAC